MTDFAQYKNFKEHIHETLEYIIPLNSNPSLSPNSSLQRQHTRPVRKFSIVTTRGRRAALVQQLQVARVNSERLIRVLTVQIAVTDIVRPRRAAVRFTRKRVLFRRCLRRPATAETRRREGPKVSSVAANCLHNHEIFLLPLERVHLDCFEQVVGAIAHHCNVVCAKAAGEVTNRHAGSVYFAIVAAEKEVHVGGIGDQGLINWACARARNAASEERLCRGPRAAVRWVLGRPVRKRRGSPLMGQDPSGFWSKVEQGRRDSSCDAVLGRRSHVRPVREGSEHHGSPVVAIIVVGGVYDLLAVVVHDREIFKRSPAGLWLCERIGRCPAVG
jgi:hypothetical protein